MITMQSVQQLVLALDVARQARVEARRLLGLEQYIPWEVVNGLAQQIRPGCPDMAGTLSVNDFTLPDRSVVKFNVFSSRDALKLLLGKVDESLTYRVIEKRVVKPGRKRSIRIPRGWRLADQKYYPPLSPRQLQEARADNIHPLSDATSFTFTKL